jgi:hypothetical protein
MGSCRTELFLPVLFELPHLGANVLGVSQLASLCFVPAFLNLRSDLVAIGNQPIFFGAKKLKCPFDHFFGARKCAAFEPPLDERFNLWREFQGHAFTIRRKPGTCKSNAPIAKDLPDPDLARDNGFMQVPRAHVHQTQFMTAIARAAQSLAPDVAGIIPSLGNDWAGEPAVFFTVILSDAAASKRDQLLNVAHRVSSFIVQHVEPLEKWGVLPYFTYRSHAEQAKLEPSLA